MNRENKTKVVRIIATVVILALIIIGVYFLAVKDRQNQTSESNSPTASTTNSILTVKDSDWIKGKKDAKAVIIEYSDFQCPACGYVSGSLDELLKKYPSDTALVYRHFPLSQHQFAFDAATASEIAGASGKFWEMHDALFANQDKLSRDEILNIAVSLGFNRDDFAKKLDDRTYKDPIYADQQQGEDLKLDHTPTLYINGVEYDGNLDEASIESAIKKYL